MAKNYITIGTFDGVHLGHKHLLYVLKDLARLNKMNSLTLAFALPPKVLLSSASDMAVLTLPDEKFARLNSLGIGKIEELNFNKIKNITCQDFFDVLLKKYDMGGLLVGPDFAFGKDRAGHLDFLRKACLQNNISFTQANFVETDDGHKISSSLIRKNIKEGNLSAVNTMLGYEYEISGPVVKGRQLGRQLGFATANLDVDPLKILPFGIFAARVKLGRENFKAVCNIGLRPTVETHGKPLTEVHILDFDRDIYGRNLTVNLAAKIRGEQKFNTLGELTQQINKDAAAARKLLS
ncbi:MAG: riboflavin biosynthesis protein RibF [Elusimicrobiota bacterium]|jgi:riboflavin kinase/FMN adenylyltransferase|nr:riboflavin biosynthesis protein RibF [Elusimicrobiota bacterium]